MSIVFFLLLLLLDFFFFFFLTGHQGKGREAQSRHNLNLYLTEFLPLHLILHSATLWKSALKWEPACYCARSVPVMLSGPHSWYYLWCVSSSQCATAVRLFLSTFNSNLAHYSQTTKALSMHSGAHCSEWWIFPITLLSIQVSDKHRPTETALEKPCSYICLTPGVLGNESTISTKTSKLKGKVKYSKSSRDATPWKDVAACVRPNWCSCPVKSDFWGFSLHVTVALVTLTSHLRSIYLVLELPFKTNASFSVSFQEWTCGHWNVWQPSVSTMALSVSH